MKRSVITITVAIMLCAALIGLAVELLGAGHGSDLFLRMAMSPFFLIAGGEYLALAFWVVVVGMLVFENQLRMKVIRTMLGVQAVSACGVTLWYILGDEWEPLLDVIMKRRWEALAFLVMYLTLLVWMWCRVDAGQRRKNDLRP